MTSDGKDKDNKIRANHSICLTIKQKTIFFKVYGLKDKAQLKMYTNFTVRFPKKSSHDHQYIMVLIKMDINAILVAAMKNRSAGKMIRAYQKIVDRLCSGGIQPKLHLL
jgi:hypothetical protein